MANQEHLNILKLGVARWNEWREQHREIQADLSKVKFNNVDLHGANLSYVDFREACFYDVDLSGARFINSTFSGAIFRKAIFEKADLRNANFNAADLTHANLNTANLRGAYLIDANLSAADLDETDLREATFYGAKLNNTSFSEADLRDASFMKADMIGAFLQSTNLSGANLSRTNLTRAYLIDANLRGAKLAEINLSEARIRNTNFAHIDLRTAIGLSTIQHLGPSPITVYTIQLPSDGSAFHFLRGTGMPDTWIKLYLADRADPTQYHSCFISYSSKNETLARRLYADLRARSVQCWFAPEDMKTGNKIRTQIDEAIHLQDRLLLLLSEHSIASTWVENEVEAALEKEDRQQREVLFPIRLDDTVMQTSQAWAATLRRTRNIGDFTNWTNPQAYQSAFERLLRDLREENNTKGETDGKPGTS